MLRFMPVLPTLRIRGVTMKTAQEYRRYAEECRALAKQMTDIMQRDQLLMMADTWDRLAEQRERRASGASVEPVEAPREPPKD
jgi:hypothetical protein